MNEVVLTRMSSKGQIVVPKAMRDALGLEEGELFAMVGEDDTIVIKRVDVPSEEEFGRILAWGARFAKRKRISRKDVEKAIAASR